MHSLFLDHCPGGVVFSFHVGSECNDGSAYSAAVISAKEIFDMAEMAGFHFNLLDIGGGFPGCATPKLSFDEARYSFYYSYIIRPFRICEIFNKLCRKIVYGALWIKR